MGKLRVTRRAMATGGHVKYVSAEVEGHKYEAFSSPIPAGLDVGGMFSHRLVTIISPFGVDAHIFAKRGVLTDDYVKEKLHINDFDDALPELVRQVLERTSDEVTAV